MPPPHLFRALHAFRRNEQGAVAILFGLMTVLLVMIVGAAIDTGNAYRIRSALQESLDAAMLTAGANPAMLSTSITEEDMEKLRQDVRNFFNANLVGAVGEGTVSITALQIRRVSEKNVMHADLTATSQTFFGRVLNLETLTYSLTSTVQRAPLSDVVLVLSEDMNLSREWEVGTNPGAAAIDVIKTVAQDLAGYLLKFPGNRVGVVPYTSTVNTGLNQIRPWMTVLNPPQTGTWLDGTRTTCVGFNVPNPKPGIAPNLSARALTSVRPTTGYPTYLRRLQPAASADQSQWDAFWAEMMPYYRGEGLSRMPLCGTPMLRPYDASRFQTVIRRIGAMRAVTGQYLESEGNIAVGLFWAWHLLTPEEPIASGRTQAELAKTGGQNVIVLFTTRATTGSYYSDKVGNIYSPPAWDGQPLPYPTETEKDQGFKLFLDICENAKADGIKIYIVRRGASIRPGETPPPTQALEDACATSPSTIVTFAMQSGQKIYDAGEQFSPMWAMREVGRQLTQPRLIPCPAEFCPASP